MDDFKHFKKYFDRSFWSFFEQKPFLTDWPKSKADREIFIERLYKEIFDGNYFPAALIRYTYSDKGNGVPRFKPIFSIKDYCVYYYCSKRIDSTIASHLMNNVFYGRLSCDLSLIPAWIMGHWDLDEELYQITKSKKYRYIAELDIANYYDSVCLGLLKKQIIAVVNKEDRDIVELLFTFLENWGSGSRLYRKNIVGLPQNDYLDDCTWFLANFYLAEFDLLVDKLCKQNKCKFVRYIDDYFVFSNDKDILERISYKISLELRSLGLSLNAKKARNCLVDEYGSYRSLAALHLLKGDKNKIGKRRVEEFIDCYYELIAQLNVKDLLGGGRPLLYEVLLCSNLSKIDPAKKAKLLNNILTDEVFLSGCRALHFAKIYKILPNKEKHRLIDKLNLLSQKLIHNYFHAQVLEFYQKNNIECDHIWKRIKALDNI